MPDPILKTQHGGYSCYSAALTLTFTDPKPLDEAIYLLGLVLTRGGPHVETFKGYCFYPEYHQNGGIHFHGVIYYTNKMHYNSFITYWRRRLGRQIRNDKLVNPLGWHFYCRKDNGEIKGLRVMKHNVKKLLRKAGTDWFSKNGLIVEV